MNKKELGLRLAGVSFSLAALGGLDLGSRWKGDYILPERGHPLHVREARGEGEECPELHAISIVNSRDVDPISYTGISLRGTCEVTDW